VGGADTSGNPPNPPANGGDQYVGLDRFGRVVDQRWLLTSSGAALERVQYGFDRASNRQWRDNLVAASGQDEYYTYDGLYQLTNYDRGDLNAGKTAISGTPLREEDFAFDPTGNWSGYITKNSGTTELNQARTDNKANEVTNITETVGTAWVTPLYDAAGNMTETPQPTALASKYTNTFDAWYRLVKVMNGAATVATYQYDGLNRRTVKTTPSARHYYYSDEWQVLEERTGTATCAERQFVWGLRYLDDLIARDRDTANNCSALSERLYALHDYFNVTALVNTSGAVQERYGYDPYGTIRFMNSAFGTIANSAYGWETLYGAYRWDGETGFYQVRNRYFHPKLGKWMTRDSAPYLNRNNLYYYVRNGPVNSVDPLGLSDEQFSKSYAENLTKLLKRVKEAWDLSQKGKCPKNPCLSVYSVTATICNCIYDSKTDIQGIIGCICLASPDPACETKASNVVNTVFPSGKTGFE
jgi:RHS repeat-associated protein